MQQVTLLGISLRLIHLLTLALLERPCAAVDVYDFLVAKNRQPLNAEQHKVLQ